MKMASILLAIDPWMKDTLLIGGLFLGAVIGSVFLFRWILDRSGKKIMESGVQNDGLTKKYHDVDISKYSRLLGNIGMSLSLALMITAFEWKTYDEVELMDLGRGDEEIEEVLEIPPTQQTPPPPPKVVTPEIVEVPDEEEIEEEIEVDLDMEVSEETVIEEVVEEVEEEEEEEVVEEIFTFAEENAEPKIGTAKFLKAIGKELKYPKTARRMGIKGKVYVQFIVEKNGRLTQYQIVRGIGGGCDEEALRAVKEVANDPKKGIWKPAKQRGKPVRLRFVLPVTFKLN